jgi:putative transposase
VNCKILVGMSMSKRKTPEERKAEATAQTTVFLAKFADLVGPDEIIEAGMKLGAIERQRKVDLPKLVQATILALSPVPGTQMTGFQNYIGLTGVEIAPSTFYDRFNGGFAKLMEQVAERALEAVRDTLPHGNRESDFGVLLRHFKEVRITDSTAHFLKTFAKSWAPSTSEARPAAIKLHATISLADALPVESSITAQRVHDNKGFPAEILERGTLHLFDLGYVDFDRFVDMTLQGVSFLTRLKESHNPMIVRVHAGGGSRLACRGLRLDEALTQGLLVPEKGRIDVDVRLTAESGTSIARVVGVEDEAGSKHWYLTTVDRDLLGPSDVAEAYRLRWLIELLFKQAKSGLGLSSILAWRESAVTALVHAKIVALCLARLLEYSVTKTDREHVYTQLAMVLVLARSTGLLIAHCLLAEGVTLKEFERRIMLIATIAARTRNRRRERKKRLREAGLGP